MKTVQNVKYGIRVRENDQQNATTASLLLLVLQQPPPGGFDFPTMRSRNRVIDAVEKNPNAISIEFEDADYKTAADCVRDYRWIVNHRDVLKFAEQFGL